MTTIYDALKSDHDKHRDLLKKLVSTQGDSGERRKLRQTFCCDAGPRAAAEEPAFCGHLMAGSEGRRPAAEHKERGRPDPGARTRRTAARLAGWHVKQRCAHPVEAAEEGAFQVARDIIGADEPGNTGAGFAGQRSEERGPGERKSRKRAGGLTRTVQPAVSR